ncbi:MAG: polysaccharide biosynthesis/export family protein [Terracidiphilus sp.]|jgi:polysaccharide export outer membrane protein
MQNYGTNPTPSAPALLARTVTKRWSGYSLQVGLLFAVAFCTGLESQVAVSQQNEGSTAAAAPTASPAEPNPPSRPARSDDTYIIGDADVLGINVWKEPELTRSIPVRSDGKISLPLIGDIQAEGRTPMQLEEDIAARLKSYITDPQVAVIVEQINSRNFNILGQVMKPGSYPLAAGTTIVDAIALAGGLKDFAKKKGVYLLRQDSAGSEERYPFNYQEFLKGKNTTQNIKLKPHDTIVVP